MSDVDGEDQVDAGPEAMTPTPFDKIQAKPAETKPCLIVSEMGSQDTAQPRISEA